MIKLAINLFAQRKVQVKKSNEDMNDSIVNGSQNEPVKVFSAADLWNIQRKRKTMTQRRWSF